MSIVSRVLSQLRTPVALSFHQGQINTLLDVRAKGFAKGLLDVADNLGGASSVRESFAKIDTAADTSATVPLLKTLLEDVEMTEKQLQDVFKKSGIQKYEPVDELFDPNRHNAVFQVPDATKTVNTVAVVLEAGYLPKKVGKHLSSVLNAVHLAKELISA